MPPVRTLCALWLGLALPTAAVNASSVSFRELPSRVPAAGPLFVEVNADASGVRLDNPYDDESFWNERYQEFSQGAVGSGVAIGDFDRDGLPDLFLAQKTRDLRVYRNLGDWKFADVTMASGIAEGVRASIGSNPTKGLWNQGVALADVDNDGWLDVFLSRSGARSCLFINQRDGTFREEAIARGFGLVDALCMAEFCDYDRDGWLDVHLSTSMRDATTHPQGGPDYLFRNQGNGVFVDVTAQAGLVHESLCHGALWWDYNSDGWPDLYVGNDFSGPDYLYRNNRDGTFTNVATTALPHVPYSTMGSDVGDVNNDGALDLFAADMAGTTHAKEQRGMTLGREMSRLDVEKTDGPTQLAWNALYLNTRSEVCAEIAHFTGLAATDWTWAPRFEDFDNDGYLDLFVTNGMFRDYLSAEFYAKAQSSLSREERILVMRNSPVLNEPNFVYRQHGDLRYEEVGAAWGLRDVGVSFGAATGDLDGDGDLDLVYSNYERPFSLRKNQSVSGGVLLVTLQGTRSNRGGVGAIARIQTPLGTLTRQLTVARGYLSSSEPVLHFGLGDVAGPLVLEIEWPSGLRQRVTDVYPGRHYTVVEDDAASVPPTTMPAAPVGWANIAEALQLALPPRHNPLQERLQDEFTPLRFDRQGPALAAADFDGDGTEDLIMGGAGKTPARLLRRTSSSTNLREGPPNNGPLLCFDANADGAPDLLAAQVVPNEAFTTNRLQSRLYLNSGQGEFTEAPAGFWPVVNGPTGALAAADFDRDGRLDVVVGSRFIPGRFPAPASSTLLRQTETGFVDVTESVFPQLKQIGLVTSLRWTDYDNDGWIDLVVALDWGTIRCFRNVEGRSFVDRTEADGFSSAGVGWWTSLAAGDFNEDGKVDFVCGNAGLNTPYRASGERPALLYQGSFLGSTRPVTFEAFYEGDVARPWRSRKFLGAKMPGLLKKFPSQEAFAAASIEDIFDPAELKRATRLAATELRSGLLLSTPEGRWRFVGLPSPAQFGPLQGVLVEDFNGDGHLDIIAAQNNNRRNPLSGRFDGGVGVTLFGNGRGDFSVPPYAPDTLVLPGDAKAMVATDLDGDSRPDIVLTAADRPVAAFRNPFGGQEATALSVRLSGPKGNATGVGGRVTLILRSGRELTREIAAGSSYYSQSTPTAFFRVEANDPPHRVRVRWPSGQTTEQGVTSPFGPTWVLTFPEAH